MNSLSTLPSPASKGRSAYVVCPTVDDKRCIDDRYQVSQEHFYEWDEGNKYFVVTTDVHLFTDDWTSHVILNDNQKARDTYREIGDMNFSLGIGLGDLITPLADWTLYTGHVYTNCSWETVRQIERLAGVPWIHTIGNHEVSTNGENSRNGTDDDASDAPKKAERERLMELFYNEVEDDFMDDTFERAMDGENRKGYFKFYHHPTELWHIILNSCEYARETGVGYWGWNEDQRAWFETALAEIPAGDKAVVYSHHPIYSKQTGHDYANWDAAKAAEFDAIALANPGVILAALSGHLHIGTREKIVSGIRHVCFFCTCNGVHDASYRNQHGRGMFFACRKSDDGNSLEIKLFHTKWH